MNPHGIERRVEQTLWDVRDVARFLKASVSWVYKAPESDRFWLAMRRAWTASRTSLRLPHSTCTISTRCPTSYGFLSTARARSLWTGAGQAVRTMTGTSSQRRLEAAFLAPRRRGALRPSCTPSRA